MPTTVRIRGNEIVRHERVDDAPGNRMRAALRDLNNGRRRRDASDPFNEAFSLTMDEYELLKRTDPQLFDGDARARFRAWQKFAQTRVGQALRIR